MYNGEKFLQKRIDSIITQTFTDFKLIISDDGSTDSSQKICEEYAKNDKRIHYVRQKKNMGHIWNFNFVLQQANTKYFTWAAQDDITLPTFLEKNIKVLESDPSIVGSISKMKLYELPSDQASNSIDVAFKNFIKKLSERFKSLDLYSMHGSYAKKVRIFLKKTSVQIIYAVYRTNELKKSFPTASEKGGEKITILNIIKYGDINVLDEVLMHRFDFGYSNKGIIKNIKLYNPNLFEMIFPALPFTFLCVQKLGIKIFLRNIDHFIQLNIETGVALLIDVVRIMTHFFARR